MSGSLLPGAAPEAVIRERLDAGLARCAEDVTIRSAAKWDAAKAALAALVVARDEARRDVETLTATVERLLGGDGKPSPVAEQGRTYEVVTAERLLDEAGRHKGYAKNLMREAGAALVACSQERDTAERALAEVLGGDDKHVSVQRFLRIGYEAVPLSDLSVLRAAEASRDEAVAERDALRAAILEVHEWHCGCDEPGNPALCVAKPEGTFGVLLEALARVTGQGLSEPEDPSRASPGVTADDLSSARGRLPSGSLSGPVTGQGQATP